MTSKEPKPVRLQRKRGKGFRMMSPNGLPIKYVGRPSRQGNPFTLSLADSPAEAVAQYRAWILDNPKMVEVIKRDLRGKNLVCWCPLDQPCHADVLLEIANG